MNYWLMKSEPSDYSIDDLMKDKRTPWDGVRNYQARNFMRDDMKQGDLVFFYHSNTKEPGIVGLGTVCSTPYPDKTAFDKKDKHYDPKSNREAPRWILVDVCYKSKCKTTLTLEQMRKDKKLQKLLVLRPGNRLSVTPVKEREAKYILSLI